MTYLPQPIPPGPVSGQPGHFDDHDWLRASAQALDAGLVETTADLDALTTEVGIVADAAASVATGITSGTTNASGALTIPIPSGHRLVAATVAQATANPYVLTLTGTDVVTVKRADTNAVAASINITIGWVSGKA